MSRVLVIGDTHEPFCLPGYLEHCKKTADKWKCDKVVHVGDEGDNNACSYHEKDPDGKSAGDELYYLKRGLAKWNRAFGKVFVCIGNHSALVQRQAKTAGISKHWIRSYEEVYETSGWEWGFSREIDGVLYFHGLGYSGANAPRDAALTKRQSCVFGHIHAFAGIQYAASERDLLWGMNVGCGIDVESYAMAYGKDFKHKPVISCGVVIDGVPHLIPMDLGTKYPRNRKATSPH
jgi:predicted phosphodiesterase